MGHLRRRAAAVYQALIVVLAGVILYAFLRARRERISQIPVPAGTEGRL